MHLLIIVITGIILLHIYLFVAIKLIVRQQLREERKQREALGLVEKEQAAKAYALLTSQVQ